MSEEEKNETTADAAAEAVTEEKPKPARKPRAAAKPKAAAKAQPEAEVAAGPSGDELGGQALAAEVEAPAEKPKRTRAAKPKAETAAKAPAAKASAAKAEKPAPPAKPAPTRRRGAREPGATVPVVRAQAKYVRSSARKARLVCDNIRGKSVEDARAILAHTPRAVAQDWSKLLESAVANAEHNHELVGEDLVIKAVHADEGPTIKRFRPRAMGRASKIRKRTAHLTILLTPKN